MKLSKSRVVGAALAAAMAASLAFTGSAFADNAVAKGANCNWTVPTAPMTNTVQVGGQTKKVITTWQNAWGTSGADYLGISNSSILNSAGSAGSSGVQNNLTDAQNSTLLGAWASTANEVPNAYNWNSFYQFYVDATGQGQAAPFTCWLDTSWDSGSGVLGPFKYRPEIVGSSRLSAAEESEAIEHIRKGEYYQSDGTYTNRTESQDVAVTTADKIASDSSSGYAAALSEAQEKARGAYSDFNADAATATLKSSEFRTDKQSVALTADEYAALGGADVKDQAYDAATANDTLKAKYEAALQKLGADDQAAESTATYATVTTTNRGAGSKSYSIEFTFTFADYTTTFTFSFKTSADSSKYYVPGDESYNPYRFAYDNTSHFTFIDSFHKVAEGTEQIIKDFAGYTGTATDWKGMNTLPRATRYEAVGLSAEDCATNVEKLLRGSIYYTLAKVADGTTTKKTVAYLSGSPASNDTTVTLGVFDYIDVTGGQGGFDNGYAGASTLAVNQLGADDFAKGTGSTYDWTLLSSTAPATTSVTNDATFKYDYTVKNPSTLTTYTAKVSADYLVNADVIECLNGSMTASELKNWVVTNCTGDANKAKAEKLQYLTNPGFVMSSANYTSEKMMNTLYVINFAYPELFPNLELLAYWYDEVYHLNTANVAQALQWGFSNATMPSDTELADLASSYSIANIEDKFYKGYAYYAAEAAKGANSSDATFARLFANKGLNGSTSFTDASGKAVNYVFGDWQPSSGYAAWANVYAQQHAASATPTATLQAQTISVKTKISKSYKAAKVKAAKKTFKIGAKAKTAVAYKVTKTNKRLSVSKKGVVTVKKGTPKGTYKIKVKVTAPANETYSAAKAKTVTVTVKVK